MLVHKIRFRPLFKLETQNYKKRQRHVSMFLLTMNLRTNGTVQESESINVIQPVNAVKLISSIEAVVQRCTVKKVFLEIS